MKQCESCGEVFDAERRYCSARCRARERARAKARQRVIDAGGPRACAICGAMEVWKSYSIYCGVECRAEANRRNTLERNRRRIAAGWVRPSQAKIKKVIEPESTPVPESPPVPAKQQPYRPRAKSLAEASQ